MANLILTPPNTLTHDGRSVSVGALVYRALVALRRAKYHTLDIVQFCRDVWGGGACNRANAKSLVARLNVKLRAVGFGRRAQLDGPRVRLA